jgi:DNA invertase Pin-like site-specific DNA recombinase
LDMMVVSRKYIQKLSGFISGGTMTVRNSKGRRAAIYLRVSTDGQTVENQRLALEAVAAQRGWEIAQVYSDAGISGAKGREKRPGLDAMLKDAGRAKFDVVMAWTVDRMGRSLPDLVAILRDLEAARVDLFLHQQNLDTTSPSGRAMFQMLGVFAEFEHAMIRARVKAGLERAKANNVTLGRRRISKSKEDAIRAGLMAGKGIMKVAREVGVGNGTVSRVKAAMAPHR